MSARDAAVCKTIELAGFPLTASPTPTADHLLLLAEPAALRSRFTPEETAGRQRPARFQASLGWRHHTSVKPARSLAARESLG
jgi:hypothetical protein